MCLNLTNNSRKHTTDLIKHHRKIGKPLIAYKIFRFDTVNNKLYSPYRDTLFNIGINESNRTKAEMGYRLIIEKMLIPHNRNEYREQNSHTWTYKNPFKRSLSKCEKYDGSIDLGIHSFINLEDADSFKEQSTNEYNINNFRKSHKQNIYEQTKYIYEQTKSQFITLAIDIKPQDIVMVGTWTYSPWLGNKHGSEITKLYPTFHYPAIVSTQINIDSTQLIQTLNNAINN